ncbi:MAG: addiction module toxin RelE [Candidatus Diapherotrites archaeon]|uniref:Addiction module toxin RelE n=1 Tax=Candidatus Iainarchaeum sp. TaxID=3101447 RepID=A0A8T4LAM1_9ARCH|nr:addiction module toxin RelE [Candidatus Diapherotrites archaeon]
MPLAHDFSPELKSILDRLFRRDRHRYEIVMKKIQEIVNSDESAIERYKHLRHGRKGEQRVHIDKHFVLTFKYDKAIKFVLFVDFDHHNHAYQ